MKLAFKILVWLIIASIVFISVVGLFTLQSTPQFQNNKTVNVDAATQSKIAAKRFIYSLKNKQQPVVLSLSQSEINGLTALLNRAFPKLVSDVFIENSQVNIRMSVALPLPGFFQYLNVTGVINPSNKGLDMGDVTIGNLTLSGNKLVSFACWFVDAFIQHELGTKLVSMVQWITLNNDRFSVSLLIPKEMNQIDDGQSGLLALRDNLALFGDVTKVKFYYQALVQHVEELNKVSRAETKLDYYIQHMFTLAQEKTIAISYKNTKNAAVKENYSALMALAIYFGSNHFELLVGDISNLTRQQHSQRRINRQKVTLLNRVDLQQHFMYSVALQLFSNTKASDAIGELKEFLDSNPGGSGFSFADLMADRAGTRLAKLATSSEASALRVQDLLSADIDEEDIMPNVTGIPEGIPASVFNINYRDVDSVEYKKMIAILDDRLANLALYN